VGILCALPAQHALAQATSLDDRARQFASCSKSSFSIYQGGDSSGLLKEEYNPDTRCAVNSGGETESHNSQAVVQAGVASSRPQFFEIRRDETELKSKGICRVTYLEMQAAYDHLSKLSTEFCGMLSSKLSAAKKCGGITKNCRSEYESYTQVSSTYSEKLAEEFISFPAYGKGALSKALHVAIENYKRDRKYLDEAYSQRAQAAAAEPLTEVPGHAEIKPGNGNRISFEDYREALAGTIVDGAEKPHGKLRREGPLIEEEQIAKKTLDKFLDAFSIQVRQKQKVADDSSSKMKGQLNEIDKSGSVSDNKFVPNTVTGAAGASQLLSQGPSTAPLASLAAPATGAGALAAAAGAGALASNSLSEKSAEASKPSAAAAPMEAPAEAPPGRVAMLGDPESANDGHGAVESQANNVKTDAPLGEPGVFSPPPAPGGDGASRMVASKKAREPAAPGPAMQPGADGKPEESLGSFHQALEPRAVSKRSADNPGGEVANLLGQMKNLFNFDENPGAGGGPSAGFTATPGAGGGAGGSAEESAAGEPPEPQQTAADEAGPAQEGAANPGAAKHTEEQSSQYGKLDTALFRRVRTCHQRSMEKGLVLYGLKERVE
jgi:hypothetical protein